MSKPVDRLTVNVNVTDIDEFKELIWIVKQLLNSQEVPWAYKQMIYTWLEEHNDPNRP
ncbi:MAG: hypothetical protein ACOX63_10090 [Christensenellales bacterium]|jgi:hypothetical protein